MGGRGGLERGAEGQAVRPIPRSVRVSREEALERLDALRSSEPGAIVGTDEAGRGPLAGPVVAAAVSLTPVQEEVLLSLGLRDSKKLTARGRERLWDAMAELGVAWRAQAAGAARIDRDNISRASLWAMGQSVLRLRPLLAREPECVVVDGILAIPDLPFPQWPLVAADDIVPAVSAASVVAKVLRDRAMAALDRLWPDYGFARHKGYPTAMHREAVARHGLSPVHRESFCRNIRREEHGQGEDEERR